MLRWNLMCMGRRGSGHGRGGCVGGRGGGGGSANGWGKGRGGYGRGAMGGAGASDHIAEQGGMGENDVNLAMLKSIAENLQRQLNAVQSRISAIENQDHEQTAFGESAVMYEPVAVVDEEMCTGCGQCQTVCPCRAIVMKNQKVVIDALRCNSCGLCIQACPRHAISIPV